MSVDSYRSRVTARGSLINVTFNYCTPRAEVCFSSGGVAIVCYRTDCSFVNHYRANIAVTGVGTPVTLIIVQELTSSLQVRRGLGPNGHG